jgi:hypothetical protein
MVDVGMVSLCSAVTSATASIPDPALNTVAALAGVASGLPAAAAVHDLAAYGGRPACPSAP